MSEPRSPIAVGYVLKRYPRFSETFVVNEILALEKAGVQVDIFALGPVSETHFQEAISRVRAPVHRIRHQFHDTELLAQPYRSITQTGSPYLYGDRRCIPYRKHQHPHTYTTTGIPHPAGTGPSGPDCHNK